MSPTPTRRTTALGATALLALALTATTVAAPAGADDATAPSGVPSVASAPRTPAAAASAARARVTLVTGDRVTVSTLADGKTVTSVKPAPGNTGVIRSTTIRDHTFVFPESAMPYLAAGLVDRDLFDVTSLIAQGYDDAHRRALPLIVQYADGVHATPTPDGAKRQDLLPSIHGAAIATPRAQSSSFWSGVTAGTPAQPRLADGMTKIWLDGQVHADLADSTAQIGAPQAWADGYDGTGATVAVLDTGIDADHPDLAGQIATSHSFVPDEDTTDFNGHGTHTASTIAGTGAASGGTEKGVAWGAHLAIGKVLGNDGYGQDSWIIAGMQWAADQAPVVNMSLGTNEASDGTDPISQAVDDLSAAKGTLFVVSAGNQGCEGCLGAPAAADDALTVGAVDANDQFAYFSSMGPRIHDSAIKPDLVAPGVDILAARSSHSSDGSGYYTTMSGTSMASPHAAGAAAIMAERHPAWSGARIKDALMSAAHPLDGYSPYMVGNGRLDIPAALGDLHATGSVNLGFYGWPHTNDQPTTRSVTFHNDGSDPVTFDLAADVTDANGTPAPEGAITLSADQVVVPAGDTASVDVTGDPSKVDLGTRLSGALVASVNGTAVTRTSLGMDVEAERYNLNLNVTGRDGQPGQAYVIVHEKNDWDPLIVAVDGSTSLRMPPGTYSVTAFMDVSDGPGTLGMALVGDPEVVLDVDHTVELNAQEAIPVTVKAPTREHTIAVWRRMEWHVSVGGGFTDSAALPDVYDTMYAQPTDPVTQGSYSFLTRWRLRRDFVSVQVGTHRVDSLMAIDSGWLTRSADTTLAYAGNGTPAEFDAAHVHGKVAVVSLATDTIDLSAYAAAAATRGAKALVVVNSQPGKLLGLAGPTYGVRAGLPVATVSGVEGAWLVPQAQAGASAKLSGGENSPYVYDLMDQKKGHIPTDLAYAPARSDLARVDTRYLAYRPHQGGETRCEFASYANTCFSLMQYISFPSTRVEYLSTEPGTSWVQGALNLDSTWDARGDRVSYRPGQHAHEDWFGPVVAPRLGSGYWGPERQVDWLQLNLPSWGDSAPGHTGGMDSAITKQKIKLYRGSHLLQTSNGWQSLGTQKPMPARRLKYRVTNDVSRSGASWGTSTSSHTEWTFWSHHADPNKPSAELPFLSLRYQIHTNLRGQVPAGHRVRVGFHAYQQADAVDAGRIAGAWLRVSYDQGKTWTKVSLRGHAGAWVGHLSLPRNPARTVTLRASAWDTHGNSITQKVVRALDLR